ncbi:MAG TPA: HesA/MoeB/ThiF family protein [Allosphingosinicella sp.]|nr:HesA/MoeB/ThiF family protein [Allosphingosinicella sp.]
MTLSDEQLDRYARHIVLKEIGGAGQRKLLQAEVVIVGAGGIGSPAIQYLAAAGVGRLTILDDDKVELANLQRQVLFTTRDIGAAKSRLAKRKVEALNPDVAVDFSARRIGPDNALRFVEGATVVLDGSDNFATRLAVSDACTRARVPLVSAAIGQFQAQIGTWRGWEPDRPCYRCFVGDAFDADDCDTCAELGVLGAMAGLAGTFAALEVVREIVGFGQSSSGRLHLFNGLTPEMRSIRIVKDPSCRACGQPATA